jgi:PAS domain S-box-containing protein
MPSAPRPITAHRGRFLAAVGVLAAAAMLGVELLDDSLARVLGMWESRALSVALVAAASMWAAHHLMRRRDAVDQRLRMLAQTTESISETVSITDMEDRLILINEAFSRTYGYAADELIGRNISIVRSDRNPEAVVRQILPATLAGGWQGEIWNRRKNGTDFLLSLGTAVVKDERGVPVALVGVGRDVTAQKAAEQSAREGLKWESIATLAGGVAHNFNNLLQRIVGHANLAQDALPAGHPVRQELAEVVTAVGMAAHLTEQLLAYSRQGYFRLSRVELTQEVRACLGRLRSQVPASVMLDADLPPGPVQIDADQPQLQQVLFSLVFNSVEAIEPGAGRITVRTSAAEIGPADIGKWRTLGEPLTTGPYVVLEVHDTGKGMDAGTLERIFEPFFSTKFTGRGLGLPAVLGIVLRHRGGIQVESQPGRGTAFKIAFPAAS